MEEGNLLGAETADPEARMVDTETAAASLGFLNEELFQVQQSLLSSPRSKRKQLKIRALELDTAVKEAQLVLDRSRESSRQSSQATTPRTPATPRTPDLPTTWKSDIFYGCLGSSNHVLRRNLASAYQHPQLIIRLFQIRQGSLWQRKLWQVSLWQPSLWQGSMC